MVISLQLYAFTLLVVRIISIVFIFFVLKRQYSLFKLPIKDENLYNTKELRHFRAVLFSLALIVFLGNIVPGIIDILAMLRVDIGRPQFIQPVSFLYTLSASVTSLVSSYLIWMLYRLAANEAEITDLASRRLDEEKKPKK